MIAIRWIAFVAYLEWGSRLAVHNSTPGAKIIAHSPIPRWGWGEATPYVPMPWDDPEAAERGRERYAAQQVASGSGDVELADRGSV